MADAQQIHLAKENVENAAVTEENAHNNPPSDAPVAPEKRDSSANPGKVVYIQYPKDQVILPRYAPRYNPTPPKRRRNFCCRCLFWTFCLLLLFIVAIAIAAGILYAVFRPEMPKYSVDSIQITSFIVGTDDTVSSQFVVGVRARNSNKKIGLYYLDDSFLAVFYSGTELSKGSLPAFYQGHKNTTDLDVTLIGTNVQMSSEEVSRLSVKRREGCIPLYLKADIPVKVKIGKLKSMKISFSVRCDLMVDKLDANTSVNVANKKCQVKF